jgi:hypothetical protein
MHLSSIGMCELIQLQIHDDQTTQPAMEEEQIDTEPAIANAQTLLATDKGEVVAEFEQKRFQVPDERLFQLAF